MRKIKRKEQNSEIKNRLSSQSGTYFDETKFKGVKLEENLDSNLSVLKAAFVSCVDIKFRDFLFGKSNTKAVLVYFDGIVDKNQLNESILEPLIIETQKIEMDKTKLDNLIEYIMQTLITNSEIESVDTIDKAIDGVLNASAVLIIDGFNTAIKIGSQKWEGRDISPPQSEVTINGPQEAFTEIAKKNVALLRRRIKSPNLKTEKITLGRVSETDLILCYIEGIVNQEILEEARRRLNRIDVDSVQGTLFIEELIEDSPLSPFPQLLRTERVDTAGAALLEGRILIIVDGSPFNIIAPATIGEFLISPEDYYERYYYASAIRLLRGLFFLISLLGPSIYIAFTTFHQEMIPVTLLTSIAQSRAGVPFPAFVEALLMEITFEAFREASVRLPKVIGQAVTMVGGLVIGEAAVQAGIVSQAMVIVVAVTGIASFTIPHYSQGMAIRYLRFPIMALSATLGLFGIIFALMIMLVHLAGLRSFGIPYLSPFAPLTISDLGDSIVRQPSWKFKTRPTFIAKQNVKKMKDGLKPGRDNNE